MDILERRIERFKEVISRRQYDLTVILENVHDPHNIGAVMRTCDSVGISEIYVLYTDSRLQNKAIDFGHKTSSGTKDWIQVNYYDNLHSCFADVKSKYKSIFSTKLDVTSKSLYQLDLKNSCALLFGNEHAGISDEARSYVDANFIIPQYGFVQSLNISVACAVTLYEALRQRENFDLYKKKFGEHINDEDQMKKFKEIHRRKKR